MIKAIPTTYKSFKFASRLEARYALWLDIMGVPWEYEREAFDLDGLTYFPDFWLPLHKAWLEIKGEIISDEIGLKVIDKCARLATLSSCPVILAFNDPMDQRCAVFGLKGNMHPDAHFSSCQACGSFGVNVRTQSGSHFLCPQKDAHTGVPLSLIEARAASRRAFEAATIVRKTKFAFTRKAS